MLLLFSCAFKYFGLPNSYFKCDPQGPASVLFCIPESLKVPLQNGFKVLSSKPSLGKSYSVFSENQTRWSKLPLALQFIKILLKTCLWLPTTFKFQLNTSFAKHSLTNPYWLLYSCNLGIQWLPTFIISSLAYRWSRMKTLDVKR